MLQRRGYLYYKSMKTHILISAYNYIMVGYKAVLHYSYAAYKCQIEEVNER